MSWWSLVWLSVFWIPLNLESSNSAQDFESKLKDYYQSVKTIQADFSQKKESILFEDPLVSKGKFYYQKPDQVRWEQVSPTSNYLILAGNSVIQFDGKSVKKSTGGGIQMTIFREFILKTVDGSILQDPKFKKSFENLGNKTRVNLDPIDKQLAKRLNRVSLVFDSQTLVLDQLVLIENAQEKTEISFSSQKINSSIPESIFR